MSEAELKLAQVPRLLGRLRSSAIEWKLHVDPTLS